MAIGVLLGGADPSEDVAAHEAKATEDVAKAPEPDPAAAAHLQDVLESARSGAMHEKTGTPKGEDIPDEKLDRLSRSPDHLTARRARGLKTLKTWLKGHKSELEHEFLTAPEKK